MRRRTVWTMLTFVFIVSVVTSVVASEKTVRFWTWWSVDDEDLTNMGAIIGAKVEYQQLEWGDFLTKLIVGVMGGESPDLIYVDPAWFDEFASKGVLVDLKPYIDRDSSKIWRDIFPAGMNLWNVDGKQHAVPGNVSPSLFWYNKDLFQTAGIPDLDDEFSWDQWLQYSKKITRDIDGDGLFDQYGLMPWWYQIINLIWSNGGQVFADGQLAVDSLETREALTFYRQFRELELICDWEQLSHKGFAQKPDLAWSAGLIGFAPGGDWVGPSTVRSGDGNAWNFTVGVALEPKSPKGGRAALLRGNGLSIPIAARNKDLAFELIKCLLGDENQMETAIEGQMPARMSIASKYYLPKDRYPYSRETVIGSLAYQRGPDQGVNWSQSYEAWDSPVKTGFNKYINGELPLDAAIEEIKVTTPPKMRPAD